MKNNWTHERISRKANSIQWTGANTDAVLARLTQHGMIGELFRDIHIQVYKGGSYDDTINIGMWLVVGENSKLRIYTDDQHELMYRPIDNELERLRAFAREVIKLNEHSILKIAVEHELIFPRALGFGCDLADCLKVAV